MARKNPEKVTIVEVPRWLWREVRLVAAARGWSNVRVMEELAGPVIIAAGKEARKTLLRESRKGVAS